MFITLSGMPCSGKSEVSKLLRSKFGFDIISVSKIFRDEAQNRGLDVLEFNKLVSQDASGEFDNFVDAKTVELATQYADKDVVFDSRLAWHFVPRSFKVFLVVSPEIMQKRLELSDRSKEEKNLSKTIGTNSLVERMNEERRRYKRLYNIDLLNFDNYNLVLDTSNMSIEDVANRIASECNKFYQNA